MEHITNVLVYSNRCEVLDSHIFTIGDKGFPHIRLKFLYMFGAETLQGKQLELKYILPDKSYQVETISVTGKDEVLFPIHYSVFVIGGWTTLKITIVEGANRITLDDITIKTKRLEAGQEFQHKEVKAFVETEITKISKKIKGFEEETKTELNTLKTNLSQNLETEKNIGIEALKEAYNTELKKLDMDVKTAVTKYLKENTDKFDEKITNLKNGKENAFNKNTAFNKNFGTTADTVLEGNKLNEIDSKFKGVAGGKVNLTFIQDVGEKIEGEYYLDKTSGKLHRCIKKTSNAVNSAEYFKDMSLDSIVNRLENLFKYSEIFKGRAATKGQTLGTIPSNSKFIEIIGINYGDENNFYYFTPIILRTEIIRNRDIAFTVGITSDTREFVLSFKNNVITITHSSITNSTADNNFIAQILSVNS